MVRRRTIIYGVLIAATVLTAPAGFLWARTMVYWWLSPDDSPIAKHAVIKQLIDSTNNAELRRDYYPRDRFTVLTPHCDKQEVDAPARWTDSHRTRMDIANETRQWDISEIYNEAAEGENLKNRLSVNQMALLAACMEATPFAATCRISVNELRWDHTKAELYLIKYRHLERLDGDVCYAYPEITFRSKDQK